MADTPLFDETRNCRPLYHAFVLLVQILVFIPVYRAPESAGHAWASKLAVTVAVIAFNVAMQVMTFRQRVIVYPGRLVIAMGYIEWRRKGYDLGRLSVVRSVTFSPIRDCVGWGAVLGRQGLWFYNTRGSQGVLLEGDRIKIMVGTDDPVGLARAIEVGRGHTPPARVVPTPWPPVQTPADSI